MHLRVNMVEIFFHLIAGRLHLLGTLVFGFTPAPVPNGPPPINHLWQVLKLEAKLSAEKPLRATRLSRSWTSRDGSRVGLLSLLG